MVELVQRHVQLKKRGSSWTGLCPFHSEKSPSFHVNAARKSFHCFGCGEGGDAIAFLMKIEGLGFVEAVQELANATGIQLPQEELTPRQQQAMSHRDELYRANDVAATFFAQVLASDEGKAAQEELDRRGVSPELVKLYRLGFAPDAWDGVVGALARAGLTPEVGEEAGLIVARQGGGHYDRFRNRLMFPISGTGGKVVAFGGRTMGDDSAKYINSPESPIYNKSSVLYGLHEARRAIHKSERVLVVEGYFDVLGLAGADLGYAVAPCGTALTDRQLEAIKRHTRQVVMSFDGDAAGQKAALKALELCLDMDLWPTQLLIPGAMDPDDYVREHGAEAMRQLVETGTRPLMDFFVEVKLRGAGDDMMARERTAAEMAPILGKLKPTQRKPFIERASLALGMRMETVEGIIRQASKRAAVQARSAGRGNPGSPGRTSGPPARSQPRSQTRAPEPPPPRGGWDADPPGRPPGRPPGGPPPTDWDDMPTDDDAPPDDELVTDFAAPRRPRATDPELLLLRVLIQDGKNAAPFVDETGAISWVRHRDVERAAGELLACWREKRPFDQSLLHELEDEEVRRTIRQDLTSEERWFDGEAIEKATKECLIRLHLDWLERQVVRVARELDLASRDRSAAPTAVMDLARERIELEQQLQEWREELKGQV